MTHPAPSHALANGVSIVGMTFGPDISAFLCALESLGNFKLNIAEKDRFQGVFLVFAVEIKAVCDYLIWEPIQCLAPASKEVLTA